MVGRAVNILFGSNEQHRNGLANNQGVDIKLKWLTTSIQHVVQVY